jgi:photosystem II stability/assembly factor-like uncharacterized protein
VILKRHRLGVLALVALVASSCAAAVPSHSAAPPKGHGRSAITPHGTPSSHPSSTAPTTPPPPTTSTTVPPAPPGTLVEDLTWVSDIHGWALVDVENCGQPNCTEVLTTIDGGVVWSKIGSIAASSSSCTGCAVLGVTHIRFANDLDGYAFDPDLFITTDGGQTWTRQIGPFVAALEPAGPDVMRVAFTETGCPGPCDLTVQSAPVASATWHSLTAPLPADGVQLVRQGVDDAYVALYKNPAGGVEDAHATLMVSHDDGATWNVRPDPCWDVGGEEYDTTAIAAAPQSVLAVLCRDRMQGQNAFVAVSTDGGAEFATRPLVPGSAMLGTLAATSATTLFVGTSAFVGTGSTEWVLLASSDGGQSWRQVAEETGEVASDFPAASFLGFESARAGRWVGYPYDIWETTDGGNTWTRQPVAP